jgi:U3 small nucleolar RNA-associated protein 25
VVVVAVGKFGIPAPRNLLSIRSFESQKKVGYQKHHHYGNTSTRSQSTAPPQEKMAPIKNKGRPRGVSKHKKGPKFVTTRVQYSPPPDDNSDSDSASSDDAASQQIDQDSESDTENAVQPYNSLLEVFNINPDREEHRRKRRRIENPTSQDQQSSHGSEQGTSEDDDDDDDDNDDNNEDGETENLAQKKAEETYESSDDEAERKDPYNTHFDSPDQQQLDSRIKAITDQGWDTAKREIPGLGRTLHYSPKGFTSEIRPKKNRADILSSAVIKKRLANSATRVLDSLTDSERAIAPYVMGYSDMLFGGRTAQNAAGLRKLSCLHVLNHVFKTRDKVLKHNGRLSKETTDGLAPQYRDQGFTRPKVLFLLPTRNACAQVVQALVDICEPEQQENRKRFEDDFTKSPGAMPENRPDDFKDLFAGNDDDMFRMGIKFTRKTIKFFSQFYNSDFILASPLGLRNAIGTGE